MGAVIVNLKCGSDDALVVVSFKGGWYGAQDSGVLGITRDSTGSGELEGFWIRSNGILSFIVFLNV